MSDSSSICLSCLLCCDGTLIGFVQLESEEILPLKGLLDIEEDSNGSGVFLHPCKNLCADGCTIYDQRPKQCRSFNCSLLKSVEQKEVTFDSAVEVINAVKEKKSTIEKQIAQLEIELKSPSFYFKMVELKKILKRLQAAETTTPKHLALIANLEQLDILQSTTFGISPF